MPLWEHRQRMIGSDCYQKSAKLIVKSSPATIFGTTA